MPDEDDGIIDDATKLEHPDVDEGGAAEAPEPDEPEDDLGEPDVKV